MFAKSSVGKNFLNNISILKNYFHSFFFHANLASYADNQTKDLHVFSVLFGNFPFIKFLVWFTKSDIRQIINFHVRLEGANLLNHCSHIGGALSRFCSFFFQYDPLNEKTCKFSKKFVRSNDIFLSV